MKNKPDDGGWSWRLKFKIQESGKQNTLTDTKKRKKKERKKESSQTRK